MIHFGKKNHNLDLTISFWSRPNHNGQVQIELVRPKPFWTDQNCFGHIEGQGISHRNLYTPTQALLFFSISMPATHISSAVISSFLWELTPFLFKVTEWFLDDLPPFFRKSLKNFLSRAVRTRFHDGVGVGGRGRWHRVLIWGFTQTFPWNQDATLKYHIFSYSFCP